MGLGLTKRCVNHWRIRGKTEGYLAESSGLGVRPSICEWVLVVIESIAISSDDDNTENFRQEHLVPSVVNYFLGTEVGEKRRGRAWWYPGSSASLLRVL